MNYPFMPEGLFPVSAIKPTTTNGALVGDYISVKNAEMVWVVLHFTQAVGHATAITLERATAVAPTGSVAIANAVPIWYGNVTTASTQLTAQTAAVSYAILVGVTGDIYVIFEVDPASLGTTYDCLTVKTAASAQVTNFVEATYWIKPKYQSKVASMTATEFIVD